MTETRDSITSLLTCLSSAMKEAEPLENRLAALNTEINGYRSRLQEIMKASETKTVEGHGLRVMRSSRSDTVIVDQDALTKALRDLKLYHACTRLDIMKAKKIAAEKNLPGVEKRKSEVFSIRRLD